MLIRRTRALPFTTLMLAALMAAPAHAQQRWLLDELDVRPDIPNPALVEGAPLFERSLSPEEYRAWVTHPPSRKLDELARANPVPRLGGGNPQFAAETVGDILVVDGTSQTVLSVNQDGSACTGGPNQCYKVLNHQGRAVDRIVEDALDVLGDNYDMIVVWTTFEDYSGGAYYSPLRNDIQGLGKCNQSQGQDAIFGCMFDQSGGLNLQGEIFMNSVDMWMQTDQQMGLGYTEDDFESQIYSTLAQESAHRWLVGFHINDPDTGADSTALLGRDRSHWNLKVDANGSVMDGLDWEHNGGSNFEIVGDNDTYSPLDLYAMGLASPDEVEPFFIVKNAFSQDLKDIYRSWGQNISGYIPDGNDELFVPPVELTGPLAATGTLQEVTIDDIITTNRARVPSAANSPKEFKQAFVLVTYPGESQSSISNKVEQLELVRTVWEQWFAAKTGGRGTVCTALDGVCRPAQPEIRDLRMGEWKRGETVDAFVSISNPGGRMLESATARISTAQGFITLEQDSVTITNVDAGQLKESGTPFRLRAENDLPCSVTSVPLTVTVETAGNAPVSRQFSVSVGECTAGQGGSSTSSGGVAVGPGGAGGIPVGPCRCASPAAEGAPLMALALLGLGTLLRRRRK
ncbi:MAG: hypothetical protein AB2A00_23065 [Myxococcota bacterium]